MSELCDNGLLVLQMPLKTDDCDGQASAKSGRLLEITSKCVTLHLRLDESTPLTIEAQEKRLGKHPTNGPACILIKVTSRGLKAEMSLLG